MRPPGRSHGAHLDSVLHSDRTDFNLAMAKLSTVSAARGQDLSVRDNRQHFQSEIGIGIRDKSIDKKPPHDSLVSLIAAGRTRPQLMRLFSHGRDDVFVVSVPPARHALRHVRKMHTNRSLVPLIPDATCALGYAWASCSACQLAKPSLTPKGRVAFSHGSTSFQFSMGNAN